MTPEVMAPCQLPPEVRMREYLPCEPAFRQKLFAECDNFSEYLARRWLDLDFLDGSPCIRARHFVGVFPFRCRESACQYGKKHLLLILPKGCRSDDARELLPFLELLAIAGGGQVGQNLEGF